MDTGQGIIIINTEMNVHIIIFYVVHFAMNWQIDSGVLSSTLTLELAFYGSTLLVQRKSPPIAQLWWVISRNQLNVRAK